MTDHEQLFGSLERLYRPGALSRLHRCEPGGRAGSLRPNLRAEVTAIRTWIAVTKASYRPGIARESRGLTGA